MKKVKFTAARIAAFQCPPGKKQDFLWDTEAPGLGLRATDKGAKAYVFQDKLPGEPFPFRTTIGSVAAWPLDLPKRARPEDKSARSEARRLKILVDSGRDPRQVKQDELDAEQAARDAQAAETAARELQLKRATVTLGMAWPVYIETKRHAPRRGGKKGWSAWHIRDHENVVRRGGEQKVRGKGVTEPGPLASLLDVRLSDLTAERIGTWLATEKTTRPTRADLAFRLLSGFVHWCDSRKEYKGLVPAGACKAEQVVNQLPRKNAKKDDCLQCEQLAPWFKAVREMGNPVQSAYLQALLLTGARRRELAGLRWDDVDFQWLKMVIRDKVEGERTIPLTPYVSHLLAALPRRNQWVFSSPTSANGQLAEPTPGHKRALVSAGLPDLTLHGLRRSFGTLAEWTETPAGVVAQIMGHKPSATAEKHYRDRPIDLLRKWHIKLEQWMLEQAGIDFTPVEPGLRIVPAV